MSISTRPNHDGQAWIILKLTLTLILNLTLLTVLIPTQRTLLTLRIL